MTRLFLLFVAIVSTASAASAAKMCVNCTNAFNQARSTSAYAMHAICTNISGSNGAGSSNPDKKTTAQMAADTGWSNYCWCRATIGSVCTSSWTYNNSEDGKWDMCFSNCFVDCVRAMKNAAYKNALLTPGS
ncbi:MAG: hypothetical protein LBL21_04780 [Rickettsiales bacterium]|nr:hypothetical protein [Rickettsiales bacterium]